MQWTTKFMNLLFYMMLPHNIKKEGKAHRWILGAYRKTGGCRGDNFPHESFISGYTKVFFFLFVMALVRIQTKPMQEEEGMRPKEAQGHQNISTHCKVVTKSNQERHQLWEFANVRPNQVC